MKKIIYICLLLALPLSIMAQETVEYTKKQGDEAYADARYTDAITIYESVLAKQGASLSLYYNLGNAYYRNNQPGKAILNYERALRIDANDEDAKANLEFVQSRIVDKIPQDEVPFYKKWGNAIAGIFSQNVWAIIGIITFVGMLVATFFYYFRNRRRAVLLVTIILCLLITIIANISAYSLNSSDASDEAVIMDEMVIVKSSPDSSGTELTKIHEGLKVKIIDEIVDWVKIEADNGNSVTGWVKSQTLERI